MTSASRWTPSPNDTHASDGLQRELEAFDDQRFNLLAKLSQPAVGAALSRVGRHTPLAAPYVVEIDPTTACNLACPECISGSLLNHGSLSVDKLTELIDDLVELGTAAVIFIGGGEPTAHPHFSRLVEHAHAGGLKIGVTTNGTLIDRHREALARCASWTRVSVDAARPDTFRFFRPSVGDRHPLDSVVRQMRGLAEVKQGDLGYSFLVLERDGRNNIDEIEEAAALARDIGCDYIEIKPSMNLNHTLTRWRPDELERMMEGLERARRLQSRDFSVLAPITLFHAMHGAADLDQEKDYDWCPATHYRTVVTPDGCYVCPYHRGNRKLRYGGIASTRFRDLWSGDALRTALQQVDPRRDCRFHCVRHRQNEHVLSLAGGDGQPAVNPPATEERDHDPFI